MPSQLPLAVSVVVVISVAVVALWAGRRLAAASLGRRLREIIQQMSSRTTVIDGTSVPRGGADRQLDWLCEQLLGEQSDQSGLKLQLNETENRLAQMRLRLERESNRSRTLLDALSEAVLEVDVRGRCTFCNTACVHTLGFGDQSQLVGLDLAGLFVPPEGGAGNVRSDRNALLLALETGDMQRIRETPLRRADGTKIPVECLIQPLLEHGQIIGALLTFSDVSERKRAEEALFREREHAQVTLESIGDGVVTADALGRVRYLNPVAENVLGWKNRDAIGKPLFSVFRLASESMDQATAERPVERLQEELQAAEHEALLIRRDQREIFVEQNASPIRDRNGRVIGAIVVFSDVTEARRMAHQLEYQAKHDALTGLINRREFEHRLEQVLIEVPKADEVAEHALCYLDLDQFKVVNDTCGHVAGDELLRQLSNLLRSNVRHADALARLGGDEFGILLESCPLDQTLRIANQLRQNVQDFRFAWEDKTFTLGISIGVVMINPGDDKAYVLSAADTACYMAKESGRNRVKVYHPDDTELQQRHGEMHWVTRISRALEENRFRLFYQPIVPIASSGYSDDSRHYELLLRMVDEAGNLAPPGAFLPAAERYNMIQNIDRWVVRTAFEWLATRLGSSAPITIELNLSGPTVSDDTFLEFVLGLLEVTEVDPEWVCFEITETAAIAKLTNATRLIQSLKDIGFRFALDDFGSGLSSFGYLKNLPVDYLKIDGSFIKDILDDPIDRALVKSINDIGHVMGKKTIAEYVENDMILQVLDEIGIDYAQGYGIARPRPLELLKTHG